MHKYPTSWTIWCLLRAPDHLPLVALPCSQEYCNHWGKNFSRKSSLSKHMLVIQRALHPSEILQGRYMAQWMARESIAICYTIFKKMITFKEHMKRCVHLLAPGPVSVKGGIVRKYMLLLDGISAVWGNKAKERKRGFFPVRISCLCQHLTSTNFGSPVAMYLSARIVA